MSQYGTFPPTCIEDIMSYDTDEVVTGYRDWHADEVAPGPNHSPGYRWGWTNAAQDRATTWDEFMPLRFQYIRTMRMAA